MAVESVASTLIKMKPVRLLALAVVAAALAACSLSKVAYNNAGFVLTYVVDDYFDLSSGQEDWVRERFGQAIAWHRQTELPEYERFLRETISRTERPIVAADVRFVSEGLRSAYRRMIEKLLPDMADFLVQLDSEQTGHFEKRFSDESAKISRETVKPDERARTEQRTKKMIEQVEGYTGRLNADQRDLVSGRVHFMVEVSALRIADRRTRQESVVQLLRSRPAKAEMMAGLRRVLVDTATWRDPEYTAKLKQREDQVIDMVVALAATLTPEQRGSVQKKLRSYLKDVTSLMALR